jgi:hypothetical protein
VDKTNPKIERVLSLVEPGRRDALRKILATAAYAAPVVASFSLDSIAEAGPLFGGNQGCLGANQTCSSTVLFSGTVKCKGLSMDRTAPAADATPFHMTFDVELRLCEGLTGGTGEIRGGPATLVGAEVVRFIHATFPEKNDETHGFAITECALVNYYETGQWKHTVNKNGEEKLKGSSWVLVNTFGATLGTAYTLDCDYDLRSSTGAPT